MNVIQGIDVDWLRNKYKQDMARADYVVASRIVTDCLIDAQMRLKLDAQGYRDLRDKLMDELLGK